VLFLHTCGAEGTKSVNMRTLRQLVVHRLGVGQVVAAALGNGAEVPVSLDELEDGNVVGVSVGNVAS
jgi:hypothetical protein